jgi:hypothetical protein
MGDMANSSQIYSENQKQKRAESKDMFILQVE